MKKLFIVFVVVACFVSCKQRNSKTAGEQGENTIKQTKNFFEEKKVIQDSANFTTIQWIDSIEKDLGSVREGPEVEVAYKFKNTGDKPLVISNVHASCGCTIPETPKEPFKPGELGTIRARFTTKGHLGTNEKSIYITANTKGSTNQELKFRITVEANK